MKKPETKVGGIRLTIEHWRRLRSLMAFHHGRDWLVKFIDREYRKMVRALGGDK